MKDLLFRVLAVVGLALTVVPAVLVFAGSLAFETHTLLMGIGMVCWFAAAPRVVGS